MSATRLYVLTPPVIPDLTQFATQLARVLDAAQGTPAEIACVQLRLKDAHGQAAPDEDVLRVAEKLLPIAHQRDTILLINDRADLAKRSGADGVHLGQQDGGVAEARALLGDAASIGVTCHDSKHLAMVAGEQGADYVAFGAFFPSQTKQAETHPTPDLIEWWVEATILPCVAIGGINPTNAKPLIAAGADFIALSSGLWAHPQGPEGAIKAFIPLLA